MNSVQSFMTKKGVYVGLPKDFEGSTRNRIFDYIEDNHYRGVPRQDDGEVNPYQYCYGLGYILDNFQMFGGLISGYPTQSFQHYAEHIVEQKGNPWVSSHVANIYRIVAHYPDHANQLLEKYENLARRRGIKILYSLPTKRKRTPSVTSVGLSATASTTTLKPRTKTHGFT